MISFQVIPQLIARIDTQRQLVRKLIHQLLTDIGKHHPQVSLSMVESQCLAMTSFRH
jgi:FKBP12-rapamycin complex-associated protein